MEKIDSIKDPRVVHARTLATAQGRAKAGEFLLEGLEQIEWGLEAHLLIQNIFVWEKYKEFDDLKARLASYHIPQFLASEGILKKITGTNYVIPIVAVAKQRDTKKTSISEMVIVLDNLVDHGNIGTIIRSAAAFGIKNIISTNQDADFFYKKIIDASRGKVFETHIQKLQGAQGTIRYLKEHGYQIVATSPHAKTVQSLAVLTDNPVALVLGNETEGCSQSFIDRADLVVQIPMSSAVESLNVAVAAGISMYEIKVKLVIAMLIQKIHKNLGRQFGVTHALIRQAFDHELNKVTQIGSVQLILLMILKCDQFMSFEQVSKDTGEPQWILEDFLKPLIDSGYVRNGVQNGKLGIVNTKAGEELLAKLWPIIDSTEEKILTDFSETERAQLVEYFTRIQENCTKIMESSK
jgi:RNA methyltransferase, TrmH family